MLTGVAALAAWGSAGLAAEDGEALFVQQCQTCHTLNLAEPPRQGPTLARVMGRKAGTVPGFPYSKGLKTAGFEWTPERMDKWIADPQAMISDSYMAYHQPDPAIRAKVVEYLAAAGSK